jgi:archaellum biogenesis ATPase FlaH
MNKQEKVKNYTYDLQYIYVALMVSKPILFARCSNILKPEYFHDKLKPTIKFIIDHYSTYSDVPSPVVIAASTKLDIVDLSDEDSDEWFYTEIEQFCIHRAMELVIMDSSDFVEYGTYFEVQKRLDEALSIRLTSDLGTNIFDDPEARLKRMVDKTNIVSTGWKSLDWILYGGFDKGSLNIFAAPSGLGKSLFLQNLAVNWSSAGKDVVYITLELSEDLVCARLDAMLTGLRSGTVYKEIHEVVRRENALTGYGKLIVKKFPEVGTTANMIKSYLKEYQIKFGKMPDALLIDYMDLMYPNNSKIDVGNLFAKDKFVAEEMRGLFGEFALVGATASQLNRSAVNAAGEFDHSHIAGGMSKINTADNVFSIFTTDAMKARGEYSIKCLKVRSSPATGKMLSLAYDIDCLRIIDMPVYEGQEDNINTAHKSEPSAYPIYSPTKSSAPWDDAPKNEFVDLITTQKKVIPVSSPGNKMLDRLAKNKTR